jgi:imidazolonepropionase-like amidohydrolase
MVRLFALAMLVGTPAPGPARGQDAVYAFVNVNVVPMDRDHVLTGQTVVVRGGRIVALGQADRVTVPAGAVRIDGAGKYLLPGLTEMHAHIPPGAQVADSTIERVLELFAVNGVTTVRGMLGHPRHLAFRERAARNEILSPTIYTTGGPSFSGQSVPTPDSAERMVRAQKAAGYDLLKIHPGIRRDVFEKLAATAKEVGIRFAGHVPLDLGIERAIELRYWTVDHLDGFVEGLVPENRAFTPQEAGFFGLGLIDRVDESRIAVLARKAKDAGVWVVPTETLMQHVVDDYAIDDLRARPEMKYMSSAGLDGWVQATTNMRSGGATMAQRKKYVELRRKLIKGLHQAGVKFLLGSDAPQVWNVPGFSVRRELELLVAAGLTPYQALESGTRNVAEHFGTLDRTGTIAQGKQADLILLDGNPLADIANVNRQAGVMVRGRWLDAAEIGRRLAGMVAR